MHKIECFVFLDLSLVGLATVVSSIISESKFLIKSQPSPQKSNPKDQEFGHNHKMFRKSTFTTTTKPQLSTYGPDRKSSYCQAQVQVQVR